MAMTVSPVIFKYVILLTSQKVEICRNEIQWQIVLIVNFLQTVDPLKMKDLEKLIKIKRCTISVYSQLAKESSSFPPPCHGNKLSASRMKGEQRERQWLKQRSTFSLLTKTLTVKPISPEDCSDLQSVTILKQLPPVHPAPWVLEVGNKVVL